MSINTDDTVSLEPSTTEVEVVTQRDLTVSSSRDVDVQAVTSTVEGNKKEYSIIGDGLYASVTAEETPFWLTSLIDNAVDTAVASGMVNYDLLVQDVQNAISALNVAQNTYVEQINIDATINGVITTRLATLNSTFDQTFATKAELSTTVATSESALAQDISDLSVTLNGAITSQVATSQLALATENSALAADILVLTTSIETQNGDIATAISDLQTTSTAYTDATGTGIENRFAYNSEIRIGGNYYKTGFGLNTAVTTSGNGTVGNGYSSEFWIDAEKFKFTNSAETGATTPFAIDASGATPQITFNGLVSFSNTTGTPTNTSGSAAPTGTAVDGSTYTQTSVTPHTVWVHSGTWKATNDPDVLANAALDATTKADLAQAAAELAAQTKADLAQVTAEAYADGIVTAEEARAILDATTKANAAQAAAEAASDSLGSAAAAILAAAIDATNKADAAEAAAIVSAQAKANLAQVNASAYADGIVTAEEARAIADATAKANAAQTAAETAAAVDAAARVAVISDNIYVTSTTTIDGGRIYTGTVTADAIEVGAITADMVTTGTGPSRIEISNTCIKVYDNGALRVKIGDLS
jgi:hypothetical protein